jgi:single-stranded DNA-specific DHH superfamily exonuclease
VEAVRRLKEQGAGLLVTVDCGTASHEPLAKPGTLGLDPLVLDHHQAPEKLPPRWLSSIRTGRTTSRALGTSAPPASSSSPWWR